MRSGIRTAIGAAVALLTALGLVAASRLDMAGTRDDAAMVRLTWSARPERIEHCRTLSDAELAEVPAHMRQREVCEGRTASYRVTVLRDGVPLAADSLHGGGLRHDRQLYHFREISVPAGPFTLEVHVARVDSVPRTSRRGDGGAASNPVRRTGRGPDRRDGHDTDAVYRDGRPDYDRGERRDHRADADADAGEESDHPSDARERRIGDEVPARLDLRETLTLRPREVVLVTYDRDARRLQVLRSPGRP